MSDRDWGFLLLDKPEGLTSHTAANRAARALGFKKTGHAGTLDPMATGLMLVGLGRATRLLEYLVGLDKTYVATIRFGVETDTLDREGKIIREEAPPEFTRDEISAVLAKFTGEIRQTPPMHSAIKVGGRPLYKIARKGGEIEIPERVVQIRRIEVLASEHPLLTVEVACSSGTYIRSLARDIGQTLGTCASLWALRRTVTGRFSVDDAAKLDALATEAIRNPAEMVDALQKLELGPDEITALVHGKALNLPELAEMTGEIAVFDKDGTLSAICEKNDNILKPRKVFLDQPQ